MSLSFITTTITTRIKDQELITRSPLKCPKADGFVDIISDYHILIWLIISNYKYYLFDKIW